MLFWGDEIKALLNCSHFLVQQTLGSLSYSPGKGCSRMGLMCNMGQGYLPCPPQDTRQMQRQTSFYRDYWTRGRDFGRDIYINGHGLLMAWLVGSNECWTKVSQHCFDSWSLLWWNWGCWRAVCLYHICGWLCSRFSFSLVRNDLWANTEGWSACREVMMTHGCSLLYVVWSVTSWKINVTRNKRWIPAPWNSGNSQKQDWRSHLIVTGVGRIQYFTEQAIRYSTEQITMRRGRALNINSLCSWSKSITGRKDRNQKRRFGNVQINKNSVKHYNQE